MCINSLGHLLILLRKNPTISTGNVGVTVKMSEPTSMTIQRLLSPSEWTKKQIDTLSSVGLRNYQLGISRPKRSPIEAGSSDSSEAKYQAKLQIAFDKKSRQKGVAASSDQIWYAMSKTLGAENLVKGVKARESKVRKFVDAWQPHLQSHLANIDTMPVTTLEERLTKQTENARGLAALHGATKGV